MTLLWTSDGADSVWIDPGIGHVLLAGSTQVRLTHSVSFTINFRNAWGTTSYYAPVFVEAPEAFLLEQNFPNPFNPKTAVSCQLPVAGRVRLVVYDLLGREVAVLMDENKEPGRYEVTFDATGYSSGVYFYRMQVRPLDSAIGRDSRSGAGGFVQTRRLLLLR